MLAAVYLASVLTCSVLALRYWNGTLGAATRAPVQPVPSQGSASARSTAVHDLATGDSDRVRCRHCGATNVDEERFSYCGSCLARIN